MNIIKHSAGTNKKNERFIEALEKHLAIIKFDRNGQVSYVNRHFAQSRGYQPAQMIGMHHREFCFAEFSESPAYKDFFKGKAFKIKLKEKMLPAESSNLKRRICQFLMSKLKK